LDKNIFSPSDRYPENSEVMLTLSFNISFKFEENSFYKHCNQRNLSRTLEGNMKLYEMC